MEVGFVALAGGGPMSTQITVSGAGAVDATGKRTVEVGFRGPGRNDFNLFGNQREEYRLRYERRTVGLTPGTKSSP